MTDFTHEMKLGVFEFMCRTWQLEPQRRAEIEKRFAAIGIIAKGVPFGDDVYLDVTIPDHIYIAAPIDEDDDDQEDTTS